MNQPVDIPATLRPAEPTNEVTHFRQILIWPVYVMQDDAGPDAQDHAAAFAAAPGSPWRKVEDEFTHDPADFQERHYSEFVTFLPPVQRFLYGQKRVGRSEGTCGPNPIKLMRRADIAQVRVTLTPGAEPVVLRVSHIDLYFFFDIDIAMLAFEMCGDDLPPATTQEIMFRLGRTYPGYWTDPSATAPRASSGWRRMARSSPPPTSASAVDQYAVFKNHLRAISCDRICN